MFLTAGAGVDAGQGEEHPRAAVLAAHRAVGRRGAVAAVRHARPRHRRPGQEGLQEGSPVRASR